jgi:hypothetical protein
MVMAKFKYRNVSGNTLVIPGIGSVEPGETLDTDRKLVSAFLEDAKEDFKPKVKEKK